MVRSEAVSSETAGVCDGYGTLHRTNSHRLRNQILLSAKTFLLCVHTRAAETRDQEL